MSDLLHQQPKLKVYIVGHTDNTGSLEHNLSLSQQRADSVVEALTARFGIGPERQGNGHVFAGCEQSQRGWQGKKPPR